MFAFLSAGAMSCTSAWTGGRCAWASAVRRVSAKEAFEELRKNPDVFVLDVRYRYEYLEEHIARSVLIPVHALRDNIARNRFHPQINRGRTPRKDQPIICVCATGARSGRATGMLGEMGYTSVRNLSGGLRAWKRARLPVVRGLDAGRKQPGPLLLPPVP